MADTKISALAELTSVNASDEIAIVDNSGTATSKKITKANLVKNIAISDLANGTDGELITWSSTGQPAAVAVGTSGHVLTSAGTGAAPTFQALPTISVGSGGTGQTSAQTAINSLSAVSAATNEHVLTKDTSSGNAIWKAASTVAAFDDLTDVSVSGQAAGDVLYFNGTNWIRLAKGTAGQALKMNAGATAPEWATGGGGAHTVQEWTAQGSAPTAPTVGTGKMYVKTIDSNNEGLFIQMEKNNTIVEVQVA